MYNKLSLVKGNLKIGHIKGGKYDGEHIYVDTTDDKNINQEFALDSGNIEPFYHGQGKFPNKYIITGASLCGKSYTAKQLALDYHKQNPDNEVFLISGVPRTKDEVYNCADCLKIIDKGNYEKDKKKMIDCKKCGFIKRLVFDEGELDENPLRGEDFDNSMIIFDDVEKIPYDDIVDNVLKFRDMLFRAGRHDKIAVISCNQNLLEGYKSKNINSNVQTLVIYPKGGTKFQSSSFLKDYLKLNNKLISKIMDCPSRWIILNTTNPMYVLYQRGAFLL